VLLYPSPKSQYHDTGLGKLVLPSAKITDVPGVPDLGLAVNETWGREKTVIRMLGELIQPSNPLVALRFMV
jgi:hypothetical protein